MFYDSSGEIYLYHLYHVRCSSLIYGHNPLHDICDLTPQLHRRHHGTARVKISSQITSTFAPNFEKSFSCDEFIHSINLHLQFAWCEKDLKLAINIQYSLPFQQQADKMLQKVSIGLFGNHSRDGWGLYNAKSRIKLGKKFWLILASHSPGVVGGSRFHPT